MKNFVCVRTVTKLSVCVSVCVCIVCVCVCVICLLWLSVRYTVKLLLQHDFFLEDTGIKVELASKDEAKDLSHDVIQLWLRVVDPKRRKHQHKEDEAIQFDYNIKKDNADKVAQEMVRVVLLLVYTAGCL